MPEVKPLTAEEITDVRSYPFSVGWTISPATWLATLDARDRRIEFLQTALDAAVRETVRKCAEAVCGLCRDGHKDVPGVSNCLASGIRRLFPAAFEEKAC